MRRYFKELLLLSLMLATAGGAHWMRPELGQFAAYPKLTEKMPNQVGEWKKLTTVFNGSYVAVSTDADLDQPYNELSQSTYARGPRDSIMLVVAWGQKQRQEVKVHNPVLCYKANGFQVLSQQSVPLSIRTASGEQVVANQMLTQDMQGYEAVTYWVRVGNAYSVSSLQTRISIIEHGMRGEIPDGILVRASQRLQTASAAEQSFKSTRQFLENLYAGLPVDTQKYLVR
jgi:EpsI family protein